jgi:phospholipid/cholesterol/gamma-HCH transport system ATP-binding protein
MEQSQVIPAIKPVAATEAVIAIKGLCKSFGKNHVLRNLNLVVRKGENVAVLGKSGSGKSVLIKCLVGLLMPDAGSIDVLREQVLSLNLKEMDRVRARVGFLFQSNALYDSMTVKENLEFPLRRHWIRMTAKAALEKVMTVLQQVGLPHTADMMPAELSGGMRKRIALARTLIMNPEIVLYDEPTTGLDPVTAREISHLIRRMGEEYGTSSIIISHDMNCIRLTADRIMLLIEGRNHAEGDFETLRRSADPQIKQFFE